MRLTPDDYTRLYRRHAQALLVYFQKRVHDAELASDLLAEVFESAIASGASFRGQSERELSGWLWTIARHTLAEQRRRDEGERARRRRLGRMRHALTDKEIERIEELAGLSELRDAVRRRLGELPQDQRDALQMRILEDLGYAEIAQRTATTPATARARVSRGLRALNVALEREHESWRRG